MVQKVALVTGSTSGIGLGIAEAFLAKGYAVILNGFGDKQQIDDLVTRFQQTAPLSFYHPADLSKEADILDLFQKIQQKCGRLDVVVNNAGIQYVSPIENFPTAKWEAILAINLTSAFHTSRLALPMMREKGWGRIINIASAHGLVGSAHKSAYVAAKHGLLGLTKVVALETALDNITCNAICPGWVETPLMQKQVQDIATEKDISYDEELVMFVGEKQPKPKTAKPGDIGALCVFLCSDEAQVITGASYPIDGGWTIV